MGPRSGPIFRLGVSTVPRFGLHCCFLLAGYRGSDSTAFDIVAFDIVAVEGRHPDLRRHFTLVLNEVNCLAMTLRVGHREQVLLLCVLPSHLACTVHSSNPRLLHREIMMWFWLRSKKELADLGSTHRIST